MSKKGYWRLFGYVSDYKSHAIWNVVFNLLGVLFTLVSFAMLKPIMDLLFMDSNTVLEQFLVDNPFKNFSREYLEFELNAFFAKNILTHPEGLLAGKKATLILICIVTAISFLCKNLFIYLSRHVLAPLRAQMISRLREKSFQKILALPHSYFTDEKKGDIMSRMTTDVKEVEHGLVSLQAYVKEPLTIIVFLFGLIFIDLKLTLIILIMAPLSTVIMAKIGRGLKRTSGKAQAKMGEVMSVFDESLSGLKVIKAFASEAIILKKFQVYNQRFFQLSTRVMRKNSLASPMSETVGIVIFCVVLFIGGMRVFEGEFKGSTFTTYLMFLYGLITPLKAFSNASNSLKKAAASLNRIEEILDASEKITTKINAVKINAFNEGIYFNNVAFKYQDEWVLQEVNLTFEKGKSYALVGHSGSGKSTLIDLILRFHEVAIGEISIDDHSIKDIDLGALRSLSGMVTQDALLFNDSVRNNLTFGEEGITDEAIVKALKIANAFDFVMELPNGIHALIGDGGGKLSGGQKQRLCIARAVLKNPPLLILDEATSALDTESETIVQEALNQVMKDRTSIVIAHRLSTIKHVDCIIVLEKGKVVEKGTHEFLLQKGGAYAKLIQIQNK